MTLDEDYQDLRTLCGAGCKTQLLTHVGRVPVLPVLATAAPWWITNADSNPPIPKQTVLISV